MMTVCNAVSVEFRFSGRTFKAVTVPIMRGGRVILLRRMGIWISPNSQGGKLHRQPMATIFEEAKQEEECPDEGT